MLDRKLRSLVGDKTAKSFADLFGVETAGDLLRHYPRRYVEKGELTPLSGLRLGENATINARVKQVTMRDLTMKRNIPIEEAHKVGKKRRTLTRVVVTDGERDVPLIFFNQPWHARKLKPGLSALFSGKVDQGYGNDRFQITNPGSDVLDEDLTPEEIAARARPYRPLYPASAKLPSWNIERAVGIVLDLLDDVPDPIPAEVRAEHGLIDLREALEKVHRPDSPRDWQAAQQRLRFEEALVLQVILAQRRAMADALPAVPRPRRTGGLLEAFDERVPFELTPGQREVGDEIFADLARSHPMHRLLQGEVGSGKTVVALRAMLATVDAGGQAALLAPTEVLAAQHHKTLSALLGELAEAGMLGGAETATRLALLTGSLGAAARRTALLDAASGAAGIVVGTHALLEERVQFADLGLVVVDEQHRFGVEQRAALSQKSGDATPHVLVMTATPIPRTVAMTVFGDLAVSTLTELPAGRSPIATSVVPEAERPAWLERAWERVREEVGKGHQVYVVCPRIGDDGKAEDLDPAGTPDTEEGRRAARSVLETADELRERLRDLRIEILHGRLPPEEKDTVMSRFAAGEIDVLVATTVIEVGVDVPNASVMVVMDADRFGISQLHQLRGRVGRGKVPGLCLLVTEASADTPARARLEAVAATTDGFELSQVDLEHRREGDVLGTAQSGRQSSLKLLSVIRHEDVIAEARRVAHDLVAEDPSLRSWPGLHRMVEDLERADYLEKT
jgi:ATP-dependent DNA helicase RecG